MKIRRLCPPSEATINMDLADQTRKILTTLTPREEKVLRMRFGISDRSGAQDEDESSVPTGLTEAVVAGAGGYGNTGCKKGKKNNQEASGKIVLTNN